MIKKILFLAFILSSFLLASPLSAQAADLFGSSAQCNNPAAGTGSSAICSDDNPKGDPVVNKLRDITAIIAFVAGASAVILILVGSIRYITSDGDSNKISRARDNIIYALIGLAVIILAATIIEFVLSKF